jgi:hypothetical protein
MQRIPYLFDQFFRAGRKRGVFDAGIAQLVEHKLPKLGVAGSNPVARSIILREM